jgi:endonuclease YncB( thermonuclease family)
MLGLILACLVGTTFAKTSTVVLPAKYRSCYDGDTCRVDIVLDEGSTAPEILTENMPVRLLGIDTPEIKGKCFLEKCLAKKARDEVIKLIHGKELELREVERGKYFRLLATVAVRDDANSPWEEVNDKLIEADLAKAYDGGKRDEDWCDYGMGKFYYKHTLKCLEEKHCVREEKEKGKPLKTKDCKEPKK